MQKPISREQWDALSEKAQWDIKVALRGPDCHNSEPIKWVSTSVIRGYVREVMRVGGTVNTDLAAIIVPKMGMESMPGFNGNHFFAHVREAANWLSIPVGVIAYGKYHEALAESPHHVGFMKRLIKALDKESEIRKELERHLINAGAYL